MIDALIVSQVVLWAVVVALTVFCAALLRQVGVLHERIAPLGAMISDRGPEVGEAAPILSAREGGGRDIRIGGPAASSTLLLFVAATCPVCKRLLPVARRFVREESLAMVLVGDGDPRSYQRLIADQGLGDVPLVNSRGVGLRYHVGKLPYAVLIDEGGVIRAKGLVNTREHLESLVTARDMHLRSIGEYLARRRDVAPTVAVSARAP